jgi:hypothetical protein
MTGGAYPSISQRLYTQADERHRQDTEAREALVRAETKLRRTETELLGQIRNIEGKAARIEATLRDKISKTEGSLAASEADRAMLKGRLMNLETASQSRIQNLEGLLEKAKAELIQARLVERRLRVLISEPEVPRSRAEARVNWTVVEDCLTGMLSTVKEDEVQKEALQQCVAALSSELALLRPSEVFKERSEAEYIGQAAALAEQISHLKACISLSAADLEQLRLHHSLSYKRAIAENKLLKQSIEDLTSQVCSLNSSLESSQLELSTCQTKLKGVTLEAKSLRKIAQERVKEETQLKKQLARNSTVLDDLTHKLTERDIKRFAKSMRRYHCNPKLPVMTHEQIGSIDSLTAYNDKLARANDQLQLRCEELNRQLDELRKGKYQGKGGEQDLKQASPNSQALEVEMLRGLVRKYAEERLTHRALK